MSLFTRIADAFGRSKGEMRPENVAYSQAVIDSFGATPSGASVSATNAMRVSAVAACVAKISGAIMSMPLHVYSSGDADIPALGLRVTHSHGRCWGSLLRVYAHPRHCHLV